ncbi:hypothetical protein [Burkholderia contaminans]|uniref:hypothetical protein n=1 Tax=Burkholderia contaminans TaxID=488447 RepID=UPI0012600CAD|nr:hypothetical protein [Burkholderia contaminans]
MNTRDLIVVVVIGGMVVAGTYAFLRTETPKATWTGAEATPSLGTSDSIGIQSSFDSVNSMARRSPAMGGVSTDYSDSVPGVESKNNKIRDDIENFIDKKYTDPKQRAAMKQYAVAQRDFLVYGGSREGAVNAAERMVKSFACLRGLMGQRGVDESKLMLAMMLNTKERWQAFSVAMKNMSGHIYDLYRGESCEN